MCGSCARVSESVTVGVEVILGRFTLLNASVNSVVSAGADVSILASVVCLWIRVRV